MRVSLMNGNWLIIAEQISKATGRETIIQSLQSISGGCINETWKITDTSNNDWFIKINKKSRVDMFKTEHKGLEEISKSKSISCPKPVCYGLTSNSSFLILEYLNLVPLTNQTEAGKQLAQMHQHTTKKYGWSYDNTIGSTPQSNFQHDDWGSFWKNERLLYQLTLAKNKGYSIAAYEMGLKLANNLVFFFDSYQPKASLLHGDLWAGNFASDKTGNPVVYDPAVYYGDRETDIAMTELFGGFNSDFYASYQNHYPLDEGYKNRKSLYNLYHILNHYNLFGGSYESQAIKVTQSLLAQIN